MAAGGFWHFGVINSNLSPRMEILPDFDGILCIPCQRFLTQLDPSESVLWSG